MNRKIFQPHPSKRYLVLELGERDFQSAVESLKTIRAGKYWPADYLGKPEGMDGEAFRTNLILLRTYLGR